MSRVLLFALALAAVLAALAPPAAAQAALPRPAATQAPDAAAAEPGPWQRTLTFVRRQQRDLQRDLAAAVRGLRRADSWAAAWTLVVVSFLYGVFHAAGPGHGKAVISTYILTQGADLRRGLGLTWASSMVQGLTAVILVLGLVSLLGWSRRDAGGAVGTLETASFALVALAGLWLAGRGGLRLWRGRMAPHGHEHGHGHDHAHGHAQGDHCGHDHGPTLEQMRRAGSLRAAVPIVLSIGLRPCSGAFLVLLIAESMHQRLAGLAAVLAMSAGTASTISVLAAGVRYARALPALVVRLDDRRAALAGNLLAVLGGLLIAALGAVLFLAAGGQPHPLR
ncbi:MAG: nickel/cobalt transporter [Hyphomicrobiales bacterium]|nr:nickel/cobalt transporter [Hyphomicrobiales bacterium]MCP5371007.1 nickel/cobalt transporter [Hyphomicrobiales bacterium]